MARRLGMDPFYEHPAIDQDLCVYGLSWALGRVGFKWPTLYVHPDFFLMATKVVEDTGLPFNIDTLTDLQPNEWYVELNGKRAGSGGQ